MSGPPKDPWADLHNTEVEQALLGALLVNNAAYEHVVDIVGPGDFSHGIHGRIFEFIGERVGRGEKADPALLRKAFDNDPELGSGKYLMRLLQGAVSVLNSPSYAKQIADLARRREIVLAAQDTIADAADFSDPRRSADDVVDGAEQRLYEIAHATAKNGAEAVGAISSGAVADIEAAYKAGGATVVDTGLSDLDHIIAGMGAGELIVLGGRPGMGKSAAASTIAFNAAHVGKQSLFFSLEMTKGELTQRWLAGLTGISTDRQRHGNLEAHEWPKLIEAQQILAGMSIAVDDQARLSVAQMRQRARRWKRRHGLDLVIVDHLQLIRQGGRVENRRLEIGDATSNLKAVAKELAIPVLLLSQLSRAVEHRDNKRPMLSDLRESGDIEQDADVAMFLFREEYYLERERLQRNARERQDAFEERLADHQAEIDKVRGLAEIDVAKNRHGRTGMARVAWSGERQRFDNLAKGVIE
jgi:replicative DNA helicase